MSEEKFIESLGVDRSKLHINGKDFYMFEMTIKRQKLLIEKVQEMAISYFNNIKDIEAPTALVEGDTVGVLSNEGTTKAASNTITSALEKLPLDKLAEVFNFVCFPTMCNGCPGYKKSACFICTKVTPEQVDKEWIENNLTNRMIKEIALEVVRLNQLEKLIEFFFRAGK